MKLPLAAWLCTILAGIMGSISLASGDYTSLLVKVLALVTLSVLLIVIECTRGPRTAVRMIFCVVAALLNGAISLDALSRLAA